MTPEQFRWMKALLTVLLVLVGMLVGICFQMAINMPR